MTTPKVSVLLSSFNHAPYLREAIDSVLNQTCTDFELIILDDASQDDSWDIIQSYDDPRIRAERNTTRIGPVLSACHAITQLARGEYIAINHSDDAWEPEKLAKQCALLDTDPSLGAVFTWVQVIDENGKHLENDWFSSEDKTRWEWLNELFNEQNHLAHPSLLIRKVCYETSGLYHPGLMQTPDLDMWCRLLIDRPIRIIPERLTLHRIFTNQSNTSSSGRPDVRIRTANELNHVRRHFLRIKNTADIYRIFPELADRFPPAEAANSKFLLAMACLHCTQSPSAWNLGLEWLFELLDDPITQAQLARVYNFAYPQLMALTGQFDVHGHLDRLKRSTLEATLDESQKEIQRLWGEIHREQQEVSRIAMEVSRIEMESSQEKKEISRLWGEIHREQQEVNKLWEALQGSQIEAGRLWQELQDTRSNAERLRTERDELDQRLESITQTRIYRLVHKGQRALKKLKVIKND